MRKTVPVEQSYIGEYKGTKKYAEKIKPNKKQK